MQLVQPDFADGKIGTGLRRLELLCKDPARKGRVTPGPDVPILVEAKDAQIGSQRLPGGAEDLKDFHRLHEQPKLKRPVGDGAHLRDAQLHSSRFGQELIYLGIDCVWHIIRGVGGVLGEEDR